MGWQTLVRVLVACGNLAIAPRTFEVLVQDRPGRGMLTRLDYAGMRKGAIRPDPASVLPYSEEVLNAGLPARRALRLATRSAIGELVMAHEGVEIRERRPGFGLDHRSLRVGAGEGADRLKRLPEGHGEELAARVRLAP